MRNRDQKQGAFTPENFLSLGRSVNTSKQQEPIHTAIRRALAVLARLQSDGDNTLLSGVSS